MSRESGRGDTLTTKVQTMSSTVSQVNFELILPCITTGPDSMVTTSVGNINE